MPIPAAGAARRTGTGRTVGTRRTGVVVVVVVEREERRPKSPLNQPPELPELLLDELELLEERRPNQPPELLEERLEPKELLERDEERRGLASVGEGKTTGARMRALRLSEVKTRRDTRVFIAATCDTQRIKAREVFKAYLNRICEAVRQTPQVPYEAAFDELNGQREKAKRVATSARIPPSKASRTRSLSRCFSKPRPSTPKSYSTKISHATNADCTQ